MPAVSPTLWVAALTVCLPVAPPFAASAFLVVVSIWRLKRPGSLLGESTFLTSSWPVPPPVQVLVAVALGSVPSDSIVPSLLVSTNAEIVSCPVSVPV